MRHGFAGWPGRRSGPGRPYATGPMGSDQRNLVLEERYAEGDATGLLRAAEALVLLKPDVIIAFEYCRRRRGEARNAPGRFMMLRMAPSWSKIQAATGCSRATIPKLTKRVDKNFLKGRLEISQPHPSAPRGAESGKLTQPSCTLTGVQVPQPQSKFVRQEHASSPAYRQLRSLE